MCGRFVQFKRRRDYEAYMKALASRDTKASDERARWNIPPSTPAWVVRMFGGALRVDRLMWGWKGSTASFVSNARVESAAEKPMFRDPWQAQRCVVPVEGWYEWQALGGNRKQPYFFSHNSGGPSLVAGLWTGDSFVLLTAATHAELAEIHTRRPVALSPEDARRWCDPSVQWTREEIERLLISEDAFRIVPVSDAVNGTREDGPTLIKAIDPQSVARPDQLLPGF